MVFTQELEFGFYLLEFMQVLEFGIFLLEFTKALEFGFYLLEFMQVLGFGISLLEFIFICYIILSSQLRYSHKGSPHKNAKTACFIFNVAYLYR